MTIGDGECTWWPDVWLGVSLTPCCIAHDVSDLGFGSAIDLGICAFNTLAPTSWAAAGVLATAMTFGTGAWAFLKGRWR